MFFVLFFFSSRRRHTRCALVTGVRRVLFRRNMELEMIINGWAWVTEQYALDREEEYFEAQEDAQRNRRGLWAMDDPEPPWEFKRRRKRLSKADDLQAHLFSAANALCPVEGCGGYMVERKSARGQFLGCSNFPRCRFSRDAMC